MKTDNKQENSTSKAGKSASSSSAGELFIVATPIGNLKDITLRAIEVLKDVDIIFCEDTRVTKKLLTHHGISAKLDSYNDANGDKKRGLVLDKISQGLKVALVSDAGTPLISDPGYKLVREAKHLGYKVTPLPGASAVPAAISACGLASDNFSFFGFFDTKKIDLYQQTQTTLVFYESAKRVLKTLGILLENFGDSQACVAREISKLHEEFNTAKLSELVEYYEANPPRGEIVILLEPNLEAPEIDESALDTEILKLLNKKNLKVKEVSEIIAEKFKISKKQAYEKAIELK